MFNRETWWKEKSAKMFFFYYDPETRETAEIVQCIITVIPFIALSHLYIASNNMNNYSYPFKSSIITVIHLSRYPIYYGYHIYYSYPFIAYPIYISYYHVISERKYTQ